MTTDLFTLECDAIKNAVFVGFRGKEQISRPYEFDLFFTAIRDFVVEFGDETVLRVPRLHDHVSPVLFDNDPDELALLQRQLVTVSIAAREGTFDAAIFLQHSCPGDPCGERCGSRGHGGQRDTNAVVFHRFPAGAAERGYRRSTWKV